MIFTVIIFHTEFKTWKKVSGKKCKQKQPTNTVIEKRSNKHKPEMVYDKKVALKV